MTNKQSKKVVNIEIDVDELGDTSSLVGMAHLNTFSDGPITIAGEDESSPTRETLTANRVIWKNFNSEADDLDIHTAVLDQDITSIQIQDTENISQSQPLLKLAWTDLPVSNAEDNLLYGGSTGDAFIPQKTNHIVDNVNDELLNGGAKNISSESHSPATDYITSLNTLGDVILIDSFNLNHTLGVLDFNTQNIGLDDNSSTPFDQPGNDIFNPDQDDTHLL